jgi:hypothetical protein
VIGDRPPISFSDLGRGNFDESPESFSIFVQSLTTKTSPDPSQIINEGKSRSKTEDRKTAITAMTNNGSAWRGRYIMSQCSVELEAIQYTVGRYVGT